MKGVLRSPWNGTMAGRTGGIPFTWFCASKHNDGFLREVLSGEMPHHAGKLSIEKQEG